MSNSPIARIASRYAPPFLVAVLMFITLLSVTNIQGFMWSHAGTAGGHLLSVARNSIGTPLHMHATAVFANGTFDSYNYVPPLFLWLEAIVTSLAGTFQGHLQAAYYFSATISAFTLGVLYTMLCHFGIRRGTAALTVAAICGIPLYATFRGFITYDILSPLLSLLFLFAITKLEVTPTRRNIKLFLGVGILALLISYYAVAIIAVYLGSHLISIWRQHGLKAALYSWPMACACLLAGFTVLEVSLLSLQEYLVTGSLASWTETLHRQSDLNGASQTALDNLLNNTIKITLHLLTTVTIAGVLFLARQVPTKGKSAIPAATQTALCHAALYVATGAALFTCITPGWSTVHPFAFFWYAAPIAVAIALVINSIPRGAILAAFTVVLCLGAPVQLYIAYVRDVLLANSTRSFLIILDQIYPAGTTFYYTTKIDNCGPFTAGHILYLGSYPNRWLQAPGTPVVPGTTTPYVSVACKGSSMQFTPVNAPGLKNLNLNF